MESLSRLVEVSVSVLSEAATKSLSPRQAEALVLSEGSIQLLHRVLSLCVGDEPEPQPEPQSVSQSPIAARRRAGPAPVRSLTPLGPDGEQLSDDEEDDGEALLSAWLSGKVPEGATAQLENAIDSLAAPPPPRGEPAPDIVLQAAFRPMRENRQLQAVLPGAVTMQGTSQSLPLPAVLNFLVMNRCSGVLRTRTDAECMDLFFDHGDLVLARSDSVSDPVLGEILVANRVVDMETLEEVAAGVAPGSIQIGSVLLGLGLVTPEDLCDALEIQARTRFFRLFRSHDVEFSFHEGAYPPADERLRIDVHSLLIEASSMANA